MKFFSLYKTVCLMLLLCAPATLLAQFSTAKKTVNVGNVQLYSDINATFSLKNSSGSNLAITKVTTSNSQVEATVSNPALAAGKQTTVNVSGKATTAGRFTYAIYIYTDKSATPYRLLVKGRSLLGDAYAKSAMKEKPEAFGVRFGNLAFSTDNIEFDYVNDGDVVSKTIYVTNEGDSECEPNLLMLPKYLSVKAMPQRLRPGVRGRLVVTLNSRLLDHRMGLTQNTVYASSYTGEKIAKDNAIPVSVVLFDTTSVVSSANAPSIGLETQELVLPATKKKKAQGELTIVNNGKSNLKIRSVQTFHPAVNVEMPKSDLSPGEAMTIKVAVVRKYLDMSSASHRILMITNDYKKPVVLVTVKSKFN